MKMSPMILVLVMVCVFVLVAQSIAPKPEPPTQLFPCPYCQEEYATYDELLQHLQDQHPELPPPVFTCPYCSEEYASYNDLVQHLQDEHPESPPPPVFECDYCTNTFSSQQELDAHVASDHPVTPPPLTGTIWGANLYVPRGGASTYLDNRVFQEAQAMGITHLVLWQYNFNEHTRSISRSQMVDAVSRMKNYGLEPIIDLEYNVAEAVALVQALGSNCMIYEVGKEPHVSGTDATATPTEYVNIWNLIVSACREVNPDAMYGGPVTGSPTTSPRSETWNRAWLQNCDGDFISVHSFTGGSSQSDAISRARSRTITDVQELTALMAEYGKNLPIMITEVQWTSAVVTNGWDYDQAFNDAWTNNLMATMEEQNVFGCFFWVLIGYDNNFAILRPPTRNYERKPQFYSIQDFIRG